LTDDERRRLAVLGTRLGHRLLTHMATIGTPDTFRVAPATDRAKVAGPLKDPLSIRGARCAAKIDTSPVNEK
jgi:hypothetical protein